MRGDWKESYFIRRILRGLVYILSFVIKPRNILVFVSFPSFADNPYAVYRYLINNRKYDKYKKVWILEQFSPETIDLIRKTDPNTIISHSTIRNWYYVLVCRYLFSSHNAYGFLHFHQQTKLFNLWHGMPLKHIGFDNGEVIGFPSLTSLESYTVATSEFFVDCMASAFRLPHYHVLLLGQPRNDLLFEESEFYNELTEAHHYKSVGIWMPTFRQSTNDIVDAPMENDAINYWNVEMLAEIDKFLQRTNNCLILKLHPLDTLQQKDLGEYTNLRVLKNQDLSSQDLYPLVGKMDYLLSDYSSIIIDYSIMDRPIGLLLNDTKAYTNNRALYLSPTNKELQCQILHTLEDMTNFIENHTSFTHQSSKFLNTYKDNNNCKRLIEYIAL